MASTVNSEQRVSPSSAIIYQLISRTWNSTGLLCVSLAIVFLLFAIALPRIDFHADEAIYLSAIPVNTSNDSGLVYHMVYAVTGLGNPTPITARWASLLLGLTLIACATRTLQLTLPEYRMHLAVLVPIILAISYQGVFAILRVRPEISWVTVTSIACWCLAELKHRDRWTFRVFLLATLFALPMNHVLSWFACVILTGYIVLFASRHLSPMLVIASLMAMLAGVVANSALRHWMVTGTLIWFPAVGSLNAGTRPSIQEFLWNVFWNSPAFLNDSAVVGSLWSWILPRQFAAFTSHCMVATLIWLCWLPIPFGLRTWESRYVTSVPFIVLAMFFASGYFNPTYSPLIVIYCVLASCYVLLSAQSARVGKLVAGSLLMISFLNGSSFLATRILNHGHATYFEVEAKLRKEISKLPENSVVAVPERFQSATLGRPVKKYILFKDELPEKLDFVALDNYDFDMYRFVPQYETRRKQIEELLVRMHSEEVMDRPVYWLDTLRQDVLDNHSIAASQGSWFFRHSVQYRVTLMHESPTEFSIAGRPATNESGTVQR